MKTKKLFGILSLLIIIGVTSCNSDTPQDNVETLNEGLFRDWHLPAWGSDHFIDCMLVKEEGKMNMKRWTF